MIDPYLIVLLFCSSYVRNRYKQRNTKPAKTPTDLDRESRTINCYDRPFWCPLPAAMSVSVACTKRGNEYCKKIVEGQKVRLVKTGSSPGEHTLKWSDRGDTKVHHSWGQVCNFKANCTYICLFIEQIRYHIRTFTSRAEISGCSLVSQDTICQDTSSWCDGASERKKS